MICLLPTKVAQEGESIMEPRKTNDGQNATPAGKLQAIPELTLDVGPGFADLRIGQRLSLRDLAARTKDVDPQKVGILPAQIDRIEKGIAKPSFRDVVLLSKALSVNIDDLIVKRVRAYPWFVVRDVKSHQRLREVRSGSRRIRRSEGQHKYMISTKRLYRYVPLANNDDYTEPDERFGNLPQVMNKYLFEVDCASDDDMRIGLDSHPGEEIVYVIRGKLELWLLQPGEEPNEKNLIKLAPLEPGDCVHYRSEIQHSYRAPDGHQPALALFVFSDAAASAGAHELVALEPKMGHRNLQGE